MPSSMEGNKSSSLSTGTPVGLPRTPAILVASEWSGMSRGNRESALIWLFHLLSSPGPGLTLTDEETECYRKFMPISCRKILESIFQGGWVVKEYDFSDEEREAIDRLLENESPSEAVTDIWHFPNTQSILRERYCGEALSYFNASFARFLSQDYIPTALDTFYSQLLGVYHPLHQALDLRITRYDNPETPRDYAFLSFRTVQSRSGRVKASNLMDGIDAIVFIADLCCYDGEIPELGRKGGLMKHVIENWWQNLACSKWAKKPLLLLNNYSEFESKLKSSPLEASWPAFSQFARKHVVEPELPVVTKNGKPLDSLEVRFIARLFVGVLQNQHYLSDVPPTTSEVNRSDGREVYICAVDSLEDTSSWDFVVESLDQGSGERESGEEREWGREQKQDIMAKGKDSDEEDSEEEEDSDSDGCEILKAGGG